MQAWPQPRLSQLPLSRHAAQCMPLILYRSKSQSPSFAAFRRILRTDPSDEQPPSSQPKHQVPRKNALFASARHVVDDSSASTQQLHAPKASSESRRHTHEPTETTTTTNPTSDLPLPPFLRTPKPSHVPDRFHALGLVNPGMVQDRKHKHILTIVEQKKKAPFATAFAHNPYAADLATPVREDSFTGARLPTASLVDFHLMDITGVDTTSKKEGKQLALLPLSLAAAMVPKHKNSLKHSKQEQEAVKRTDAAVNSRKPKGSASYVIAWQPALDYISADRKRRLSHYAIGRRTNFSMHEQNGGHIEWREDMPLFVLMSLRRVLASSLGKHLRMKKFAQYPGLVVAVPDSRRLNDLEDVMCIVRLTPSDNEEAKDSESVDASQYQDLTPPPDPIKAMELRTSVLDSTTSTSRVPRRSSDDDSKVILDPLDPVLNPNHPRLSRPRIGSQTYRHATGQWLESENETFLGSLRPISPPTKPSALYFPTMRYRNRRIALYSLPHLLGDNMAHDLIAGTVFENSVYIALTQGAGTVQPQQWLLKTHAYLAQRKDQSTRI